MRLLIAIALLFSVIPGMAEVAEAAAHLIAHGDLPHHDDEVAHDDGCAEHTCTPLAHHCGCHVTMSARLDARTVDLTKVQDAVSLAPTAATGTVGRTCEPPPLRPPIG